MLAAEVYGQECNPDDARGVHGEPDELGLVEVLGDVSRLDCVQGAQSYEQGVESQGRQHGSGRSGAGQHGPVSRRVLDYRHRGLHHQHRRRHCHLDRYQGAGYHYLKEEKKIGELVIRRLLEVR